MAHRAAAAGALTTMPFDPATLLLIVLWLPAPQAPPPDERRLPDLRVLAVERVSVSGEIPGPTSPPATPIRLRVVIANDSVTDVPARRPDESPIEIRIAPGGARPQTTRRAMPRRVPGQPPVAQTFLFDVVLPCGKETEVSAEVDRPDVVKESDEQNNRLLVKVPGNGCQ